MPTRVLIQQRQPAGTDLLAIPPDLAALADRQAGVLTRAQLQQRGYGWNDVATALRARRWRAFGRHVVVLQNAPLTRIQRNWVAVLLPRKSAALAGLSSAAAAGLQGFSSEHVHVVVSHDSHTRMPPWIKLHESRRFTPSDVVTGSGPPRTRASRAVVDAATWSERPRRACAILCAAVQQRVTTVVGLAGELKRAGRVRHAAIMRDILGDIGGGGHTLAEIDLGPLARQAGLRPPRRQVLRPEPSGRIRYVDAEFDLPDGTVLAIEIDGAMHLRPESWWDDADRQNEIVIGGRPVLRYPSLTVRLDGSRVVDQLRRMRVAHTP